MIGDGREQPVEVVLVDALREECDNSKKITRVRSKILEHRGGERQLDSGGKALVVACVKYIRMSSLPFLDQSVCAPFVVMRNRGKQGDRQRMEIKSFQDVIDQIGPFAVLVDTVEGVARSVHRQCWDIESLAVGRDGGDAGGDTETDVAELTQLLHHVIDPLSIHSLWIKNGFRIIEDDEHLLRG